MALDSKVFTPGNPPDHSAALMQIALNRPNIYKAFSQGYDDAQKRELALQQYRQAKIKADLAEQMYPGLLAEQQRKLQARMAYYDQPNQYASSPSAVGTVDTRRNSTPPVNGPAAVNSPSTGGVISSGVSPLLRDPGFETPFDPNMGIRPIQVAPGGGGLPGLTVPSQTTTDASGFQNSYVGGESPYSADDFLA